MYRKEHVGLSFVLFLCLLVLSAACIITCAVSAKGTGQAEPHRLTGSVPLEEASEETPALSLEDIRKVSFKDVDGSEPWADCVRYMAHEGVLGGAAADAFRPEGLATRAAVTAALFRMSGENAPECDDTCEDGKTEEWFAGALAWAAEAGMLEGVFALDDSFAPQKPVTRIELAVLLARHAEYMAAKAETGRTVESQLPAPSLEGYRDGGSVPEAVCLWRVHGSGGRTDAGYGI